MSYAKFHDAYWDAEKIEPLTDQAALLGAFLISGKHRNAIGCFKLGTGAICDISRFGKWGIEGVSIALLGMVKTGFIARDMKTGWTLITNQLNKDPIIGPKAAIHAVSLALEVPLNSPIYPLLRNILEPQLKAQENALKNTPGYPLRYPIEGVSIPHVIPTPSPILSLTYPVPAPSRDLRADVLAGAEPLINPATAIIDLFDKTQEEIFNGERRPFPAGDDIVFAKRWHEAGVDLGELRGLFVAKLAAKKQNGEQPIRSLKFLDGAVVDLMSRKKSAPKIPAARPKRKLADAAATHAELDKQFEKFKSDNPADGAR